MTWVAVGVAGATVVGSIISSNAAQSAASTQANAANNAANISQNQWNTTNSQQAPYRGSGYTALNNISSLTSGPTPYYDANGNPTGVVNGNGYLTTPQPNYQYYPSYQNFTTQDLYNGLSPNYDFQLKQGQGTTNAYNNATGGMVSGNAFKGMQDYTQNFAANAYQTALSNYVNQYNTGLNANINQQTASSNINNANTNSVYNRLASMAGLGQTSLGQTTNAGVVNAANVGSQLVNAGTANASGQVGTANAITGGVNNLSNMYLANNLSGGTLFGGGSTNLNQIGSGNYSSSPSMYQTYGSSGGTGGGYGIMPPTGSSSLSIA